MQANHFRRIRRNGEGSGGGVIVGYEGYCWWRRLLSVVRVIVGGEGYGRV